jgi:hypothetical protein
VVLRAGDGHVGHAAALVLLRGVALVARLDERRGGAAAQAERAAVGGPVRQCTWWQDGDEESDTWLASCGRDRYFMLNEGTPSANKMTHCCYCGGVLREVPQEPDA